MARNAISIFVFAKKREPRQVVVEKHVLSPGMLVVAVFANRSLGSLVRVVFLVAVAARTRWLGVKDGFNMTGRAFDTGVCAAKCVLRIGIVIELNLSPLVSNMAAVAAFPEMPVMIVVVFMAGKAGCRQLVRERIFAVAIVAGEHDVFARQVERSVTRMVE